MVGCKVVDAIPRAAGCGLNWHYGQSQRIRVNPMMKIEVDALGVTTISRGCFERCGSNKKTPPIDSPYLF